MSQLDCHRGRFDDPEDRVTPNAVFMPPHPRLESLAEVGEFGLIQKLHRWFGKSRQSVLTGMGDDAAVIQPDPKRSLLVTTDLLVEQVHFDLTFQSLKDVGFRAAVANLSDIAAMGGIPLYILVALAIPPRFALSDIQNFYKGLMHPCQRYGVQLVGGDTSSSRRDLFITVVVMGKTTGKLSLQRSGAQVGDFIYVTGTLGDSRAGLQILKGSLHKRMSHSPTNTEQYLMRRHMRPTPRIVWGQMLANHQLATSAIDISDGFSGDLRHICAASRVGAVIWSQALPLSSHLRSYAMTTHQNPVNLALAGGEDYELIFTVPSQFQRKIAIWAKKLKVPITCVGEIKPRSWELKLKLSEGIYRQLPVESYDHFRGC